jgi:hypothetical protein
MSRSHHLGLPPVPGYYESGASSASSSCNVSIASFQPSLKSEKEFIYEAGNLLVNLGPKLYSSLSSAPAYGLNGCITGFMILSEKLAHIENVSAKASIDARPRLCKCLILD